MNQDLHPLPSSPLLLSLVLLQTGLFITAGLTTPLVYLVVLALPAAGILFLSVPVVYLFYFLVPAALVLPSQVKPFFVWGFFAMLAAYTVIAGIRSWNKRPRQALPVLVHISFGGYILAGVIASLNSPSMSTSLGEVIRYGIVYMLLLITNYSIRRPCDLHRVLLCCFGGILVFSVATLPEVLSYGMFQLEKLPFFRFSPFGLNPNTVAIPLTFGIPYAFALGFMGRDFRIPPSLRAGAYLAFLYMLYLMVLTNSRAGLLSAGISLAIIAATRKGGRILLLAGTALALGIFIYFFETFEFLFRLSSGMSGREVMWDTAKALFNRNILFGMGPGAFEMLKYQYILPNDLYSYIALYIARSGGAHNMLLTVAAEMGLAGVAMLLVLIGTLVRYLLCGIRAGLRHRRLHRSPHLVTACAILAGLLARSIFECGILIGSGWLDDNIYFILLVIVISRGGAGRRSEKPAVPDRPAA